jgi:hypothetical protein
VNVKTYFQTFQRSRLKRKIFTLNHQRMASPPIQTYTSSPKLSDPVQQYPTPHTEESQKKKTLLGAVPFMSQVRQRWNHFQNEFMVIELKLASWLGFQMYEKLSISVCLV